MKKLVLKLSMAALCAISMAFMTNTNVLDSTAPAHLTADQVEWMSWEEAMVANQKNPKKIFVDVYTNWCTWCRKMDQTTFADKEVVAYLNTHFYAVKLNAEQKENIEYAGYTFKFVKSGRRGVHELAYSLLDKRMSYPTYVFLNEKIERVMLSPGYKKKKDLLNELTFTAEEHYKTSSLQEYLKGS